MLLGLVVLLAVVALASSGHVSLGTNNTRRPGHELADTFLSLLVVFVLLGGIGIFYVYYLQRTNSFEERKKGLVKGNRRATMFFLAITLLLILMVVRAAIHSRNHHPGGGLTVSLPDGAWFNLRASNTEPLLRLNVEGPSDAAMAAVRDQALAVIRG